MLLDSTSINGFPAKANPSKSGESAVIKRPLPSFTVVQTDKPVSPWSCLVFAKSFLCVYFAFYFCVSLISSYHFFFFLSFLFFVHWVDGFIGITFWFCYRLILRGYWLFEHFVDFVYKSCHWLTCTNKNVWSYYWWI